MTRTAVVSEQLSRHIPWPPRRQLPRRSTAIDGECHAIPRQLPWQSSQVPWQYSATTTELDGCCHGNFHGRQTTAISTAFRGIPWPSAAIATAILQLEATATESKAIFTAISTDVNPLQFPRKPTAFRDHPRQLPRQSSNTWQLPRNSTAIATAAIATAISRTSIHCNFHGKPRHSTAIRGNCHGNPPIPGNFHRTPRQMPRKFHGRQTTAISMENQGHPRQLPRQSSNTRQLPRNSTAIATAISRTSNHCNFHGIPRPSAAIALPHALAIGGHCHGKFYLN